MLSIMNTADTTTHTHLTAQENVTTVRAAEPSAIVRKVAGGSLTRQTDLYTRAWNIYSRARQPEIGAGLLGGNYA